MNEINKILSLIKANTAMCQPYIDYYDGVHEMSFATEKFKNTFGNILKSMRDNLCPVVVDAPADRMEIINFSGDDENKSVTDAAWKIWQREQMEIVSNEVHVEALKCGAGYLMVWSDPFSGQARFYPQDSRNCAVVENPDTKEVLYAGKVWRTDDKRLRLTVMFPDKIFKMITRAGYKAGSSQLTADSFIPFDDDFEQFENENPFGVVPMFRFETNPVLSDAIPIQDALNKTICDKLVAMEFAAFPQRFATGLELPTNPATGKQEMPFKAGADRLWFSNGKDTKFGQFDTANLEQYLKVADSYRLEIARVSGVPLHFFSINTSDAMSGEALKTLESRFTKKVYRLCLSFGAVWSKAMRLALQIEGVNFNGNLTTQFASPESRSETELLATLGQKKDVLQVPVDVLREEFGYDSESIAKFNDEIQTEPDLLLTDGIAK